MATDSIHPESDQGNDDLLIKIAKVYIALEELHSVGGHLWTEDENALITCMSRLQDAALALDVKTPEQCLALHAIFNYETDLQMDNQGPFDMAEMKCLQYAKQMITGH